MGEQGISRAGVIEKKVLIRASPETVFCALTSAEALEDWFCDQAASEAREGGQLQAQWRHGKHARRGRAVYRRLETGSRVELEWVDDGDAPGGKTERHLLSYVIRQRRDGCEVHVRDEGTAPPDEESRAILEEGWISVLRDLKEHCESLERSSRGRKHAENAQ